jgi:MFS family permease
MIKYLLPFLAPFVGYYIWLRLMRLFGRERDWKHPWHWLFLLGTLCILGMYAYFASFGAPAGSVYVPPEYKDGKIIPGHHLPAVTDKKTSP